MDHPNKFIQNVFILSLPLIIALVFFLTSLLLIKNNVDPNLELSGADRVLNHVFINLNSVPLLEID